MWKNCLCSGELSNKMPDKRISHCDDEDNEVVDENFGFKVRLDHKFNETRDQYIRPRLKQIPALLGMGFRYLHWYIKIRRQKRKPFIDGFKQLPVKQIYGVPIGGIGGGSIGRGFKGEFCRFQLTPGIHKHHVVLANQFIVCIRKNGNTVYQQVLSPLKPKKVLQSWNWKFDGTRANYRGLYPRAWYTYNIPDHKIQLVCRQISPIIPDNYKDSSLPVCVFVWEVRNFGCESLDVTIAFTFKNGTGCRTDRDGGCWTESFSEVNEKSTVKGVLLYQKIRDLDCTLALSAVEDAESKVTHLNAFNPNGNGNELWQDLWIDGKFDSQNESSKKTSKGEEIACAVAAQCTVGGDKCQELKFNLSWDMPVISFPQKKLTHNRRYTRWFGTGHNASALSAYALDNYQNWEKSIDEWQDPILKDEGLPGWYKSALFNELYFISDGGTVWIEWNKDISGHNELQQGDVRPEYGHFAYLEGHEYRMYNTYDVHYYASFALMMLWPKLQLSLQYDIRDATVLEDPRREKFLMNGKFGLRKSGNSVPHDIGDPEEEPWHSVNAYVVHDTADWRDLNTKFVLQVYRDYVATNDEDYLKNMWPTVKNLMTKCLAWDRDHDGLIENSGTADQTYDCWIMKGPSAYCGGLWLAALRVTIEMAELLKETLEEEKYKEILERGVKAYHKELWTGTYYKFDGSSSNTSSCIMADQLCGHWYLKASGITDAALPKENVLRTLQTIYDFNVMRFKNGTSGAVNGMMPNGLVDTVSVHSEEVWIGVTYALAATMIHEGMIKEGFFTAEGMYTMLYDRLGLGFQTPEAIYAEKNCRSLGYMRPLSIWAIQWALQRLPKSRLTF